MSRSVDIPACGPNRRTAPRPPAPKCVAAVTEDHPGEAATLIRGRPIEQKDRLAANFSKFADSTNQLWHDRSHNALRLSDWSRVENQLVAGHQNGSDMESRRIVRRLSAVTGGLAILAMVGLSASCAKEEQKAPETSTTTTTTTPTTTSPPAAPPPAPTEKSINPTGGNLFTPPVYAPPAPTEPPGVHRNK
jgi:hypothetical protein